MVMFLKGMGPLLLLFILGLWLVSPSLTQENYRERHFVTQHHDSKPKGRNDKYCEKMMRRRRLTHPNKELNTFIHGDYPRIKAVCGDEAGKPYKEGRFRISNSPFQITICKQHGGSSRSPKYRATPGFHYIVIACEHGLPVHLDHTIIAN